MLTQGVRHLARAPMQEVLRVAVLALLATSAHAQDPCDRLLRKLIDDIPDGHPAHRINGGLERLAELEMTYGKSAIENVDRVMAASPRAATADAYEQLLGLRGPGPDEAEEMFRVAAQFGEDARAAIARATTLGPFLREPGESLSRILRSRQILDTQMKQDLLSDLGKLMPDGEPPVAGTFRLLDKAGETAHAGNLGGYLEVRINAAVKDGRTEYGQLLEVDFDRSGLGGPPRPNGERILKIDTLTSSHGLQVKSRVPNASGEIRTIDIDDGIAAEDLKGLVDECRDLGIRPVLLSNAQFGPELLRRIGDPSDFIYSDGIGMGRILLDSTPK